MSSLVDHWKVLPNVAWTYDVSQMIDLLRVYEWITKENFFPDAFDSKVTSACLLGAVAHEYYSCGSDAKRNLLRALIAKVLSNDYGPILRFVLVYRPHNSLPGLKYINQKEYVQSLVRGTTDAALIDQVFYRAQPTQLQSANYSITLPNHFPLENLSEFDNQPYARERDKECLTERTHFDLDCKWQRCALIKEHVWSIPQQTSAAVDIQIGLSRTDDSCESNAFLVANLMKSLRFAGKSEFEKMDGALNWLLFRERGKHLRQALMRRATSLFLQLFFVSRCRFVANYIVSYILLLEHRYSAALLYEHAPFVFRSAIIDSRLPILVPLMTPFQSFGSYYFKDDCIEILNDQEASNGVDFDILCAKTPVPDNTFYVENDFLWWRHLSRQAFLAYPDCRFLVNLDACSVPVCFLLRIKPGYRLERVVLYFNRTVMFSCAAADCFLQKDSNGDIWYSVSLRQLANNKDAPFYTRGLPVWIEPMWFFYRIAEARLELLPSLKRGQTADNVDLYAREFNVMQSTSSKKLPLYPV